MTQRTAHPAHQAHADVFSHDFLLNVLLPAAKRRSPKSIFKVHLNVVQNIFEHSQFRDITTYFVENGVVLRNKRDVREEDQPNHSLLGISPEIVDAYDALNVDHVVRLLHSLGQAVYAIHETHPIIKEQPEMLRFFKNFGMNPGGIRYSSKVPMRPELELSIYYSLDPENYELESDPLSMSVLEGVSIVFMLAWFYRHKFLSLSYLEDAFLLLSGLSATRLAIIREIVNASSFDVAEISDKLNVSEATIHYHIKETILQICRKKGVAFEPQSNRTLFILKHYTFVQDFGVWLK